MNKPDNARREFLAQAGKFAIATPPAVAILLSASNKNYALAVSGGGGHANNGFGNGGGDGVPGKSNKQDDTR
jgi:hypothetical protein